MELVVVCPLRRSAELQVGRKPIPDGGNQMANSVMPHIVLY